MSVYYLGQRKELQPIKIESGEHKYEGGLYKTLEDNRKTSVYFEGNVESSASIVAECDLEKCGEVLANIIFNE